MIKKLILGLVMSISLCVPAYSQQTQSPKKPEPPALETPPNLPPGPKVLIISAPCDHFITIYDLHRRTDERLMFVGSGGVREAQTGRFFKGALAVWWNIETNRASITIQFPDETICLLSPADDFKPWADGQPLSKQG